MSAKGRQVPEPKKVGAEGNRAKAINNLSRQIKK